MTESATESATHESATSEGGASGGKRRRQCPGEGEATATEQGEPSTKRAKQSDVPEDSTQIRELQKALWALQHAKKELETTIEAMRTEAEGQRRKLMSDIKSLKAKVNCLTNVSGALKKLKAVAKRVNKMDCLPTADEMESLVPEGDTLASQVWGFVGSLHPKKKAATYFKRYQLLNAVNQGCTGLYKALAVAGRYSTKLV